jgi:hypothetical protein
MRLSSVIVAMALFVSPAVLAQHSSSGGSSSSSGSSGGSHGSSGGSSSGASSSHGSSSGSSGSHSASSHASSGSGGSGSHSSGSGSHSVTGTRASFPPSRSGADSSSADHPRTIREPGAKPLQPKENAVSASKTSQPEKRGFLSFLRHPFHRHDPKRADPDLRRPVCKGGDCKQPRPKPPEPVPAPVESELRHPVCKGKACQCPPGETAGKNGGCVATPTNNPAACPAGEYQNGGVCTASTQQCQPNEYWNGTACAVHQTQCAGIDARAAALANEVRAAKMQMQNACSRNSSELDCGSLKLNYDGAVERYRMLLNEAPANCRGTIADPLSL